MARAVGPEEIAERLEIGHHVATQGQPRGMEGGGGHLLLLAETAEARGQRAAAHAAERDGAPQSADDYAMMREMLTRRFSRALKEDPDRSRGQWPDLILVDGGRGHLGVALEIFEDLGLDDISIAAIAKGPKRYAGRERIFVAGRSDPIKFVPPPWVLWQQRHGKDY